MKIQEELGLIVKSYDNTIDIVEGLSFSQKKQINTIEFYSNSRYLNGQLDELGREKPFMQILNAICDVENSAKDLDTKDITLTSDDPNHYLESWLLSKDIQVWMKEADFAKTLNDMRNTHTKYGSLLVKKCYEKEKGEKKLKIGVVVWKNAITDQVDIINGTIVETHWMTAKQIMEKDGWKNKDKVLEKLKGKGSNKRIPVYEVRGAFSRATYEVANDENHKATKKENSEYSYQLYYIAGEPVESGNNYKNFDTSVVMYCEDNTEEIYKYLARKPRDGRAFGVGVFEEGEEAQVWTNDTVLKQYRAMEYTTKVIGQTASKKLKGRNLLTETDDGMILEHEDNKPITALNLLPSGGLTQYSNLIQQWYNQLEKTTSAYAAQRGENPQSGTPFRLQATVLQQSSSVFKDLQQDMGIFITEIFEDWIMPYLAQRLNKEHILAYDFSPEELKEIDRNFAVNNANAKAKEIILSGGMISAEEYEAYIAGYEELLKATKSQRFIQIPKDFYKNLEAKVTINITGEQRNKAATLETLNNILITYANNPNLANDPVASRIIMEIIELSGARLSPIQMSSAMSEKQKQQERMQAQQQVPGQEMPQNKELSLAAAEQ